MKAVGPVEGGYFLEKGWSHFEAWNPRHSLCISSKLLKDRVCMSVCVSVYLCVGPTVFPATWPLTSHFPPYPDRRANRCTKKPRRALPLLSRYFWSLFRLHLLILHDTFRADIHSNVPAALFFLLNFFFSSQLCFKNNLNKTPLLWERIALFNS